MTAGPPLSLTSLRHQRVAAELRTADDKLMAVRVRGRVNLWLICPSSPRQPRQKDIGRRDSKPRAILATLANFFRVAKLRSRSLVWMPRCSTNQGDRNDPQ